MSRQEHVEWAKTRALKYVDRGELVNALASMASDMNKHEETGGPAVSMLLVMVGPQHLDDPAGMRNFIEGFN